ncbi:MAG: hypothetical protein WCP22_10300 [Chlamydiota bacterium]
MVMFSIKALSIVEEQLLRLHTQVVAALRKPELLTGPSSLRDEAIQLHMSAFGDLANGDSLPFFRWHYIEISGSLVTLARRMDALISFIASLQPNERTMLANLSEVFIALGKVMEMFMHAWAYLRTDMKKAREELQEIAAKIARFEDFAAKQDLGTAALLAPVTDALYMVDISMKKLVVLLRL